MFLVWGVSSCGLRFQMTDKGKGLNSGLFELGGDCFMFGDLFTYLQEGFYKGFVVTCVFGGFF